MIPHSESLQSKSMEFRFLSLEDVLELHEMQLESYGGATGVRDSGLLESAVMMAQASFGGEYVHKTVFEMAAAYAWKFWDVYLLWFF